ncbi:MAG: AAA family ATPase [Bacteroidales bacterium]|nr:AAA family ATPase [Bacteroidales bacterium]
MSEKGSAFQKGGGGTNFEQNVQTAFLVTMLVGGDVPCVPSSTIAEIALQVTNQGFETDDLMIVAKSVNDEYRLLIQIKHEIAFTLKSALWREVLTAFWKDFNNTSFNKRKDKLIVVCGGLTKNDRNHLKTLFNWANTHSCASDFLSEVNRIKAKREQLDVFRTILKEANNNTELADEILWEFVKCVDVLEYDFLNEGSICKTNFLNLIKLCKNDLSALNEEDVWNSIYSYVSCLNPNGGSVTLESIKEQDFYRYFDLTQISPYSAAIKKLQNDSQAILKPIKTTIGFGDKEIHFQRTELMEIMSDAINHSQITIVIGKPGVGKTAAVKDLLKKDFPNASVFVFRADQFSVPAFANVFSSIGVNESIDDIFSCVSLIQEKIVFIDSLEKLLESDPECAFSQFLTIIKNCQDVRVIMASRKYALDLLSLKFDIGCASQQIIEIPQLDENELLTVSQNYPNLNPLLENEKIKQLLQCPKYLDFALRAFNKAKNDLSNLSVSGFKDLLWNALVVDVQNTKDGLPIKREKAFMNIAVKRAKEMKLFTKPDDSIDADALVCLENDEIVFQEDTNRRYSPTHDILEDWALERYVSEKFDEYSNPEDFFVNLGHEPAIRRAFRLWVEDYLIDNNDKLVELIKVLLSDSTIDRYWADELLISVFRSNNCAYFFEAFEKDLLLNNGTFLAKCLHIIKTCCKETAVIGDNAILIPIGDGWKSALCFISNHVEQLDGIRLSIISFMVDWYNKLLLKYDDVCLDEQSAAKSIVLHYIGEIENGTLALDNNEFYEKSLIAILFDLVAVSKEETISLVKRCYGHEKNKNKWKLQFFYQKVKDRVLSGVGNKYFVNELPELVVEVAWKEWKYTPIEESLSDRQLFTLPHQLNEDECWGIKHARYFPSGIYKTPFYNLLKYHLKEGLAFIVGFINYAVDFYVNAPGIRYKFDVTKVDIVIDDQTVSSKYACAELWFAYRALSVTSHLLESLLMSLEKYLLEIAELKNETSRSILNYVFDYVIRNSNNVAPLAVLSSVTMAYPKEVGTAMLPLFSIKEFYDWDLSRTLQESSSLAPADSEIPFAQKERWESNKLPHRTKYYRGMLGFVQDYQYNIRTLNKELFHVFDVLKQKSQELGDIVWEKNLLEMDIRNHEIGEYDPKLGGFLVAPKYNEVIKDFIKENQNECDCYQESSKYASLMQKAWEDNDLFGFEDWIECYLYYSKKDKEDVPLEMRLLDRPVTLAYIGLRDFSEKMSETQKEWCIRKLYDTGVNIVQDAYHYEYGMVPKYNVTENEIALSSFHLLMQNMDAEDDVNAIVVLLVYMLIAPFADFESDKNIQYFREVFSAHYPQIAKRVWLVLIELAEYRKMHPYTHYAKGSDIQDEDDFICKKVSDLELKLDLTGISIDKYDRFVLYRVFTLTPIHSDDTDYFSFIMHVLPILIEDMGKDKEDVIISQNYYEVKMDIVQYLALCFLDLDLKCSVPLFKMLIESVLKHKSTDRYGRDELLEFVNYVLDNTVIKLHQNGVFGIQEKVYEKQIENFWSLWNVFYEMMPEDGMCPLIEKLMLDTRLLFFDGSSVPSESDWSVLENQKEFYKKLLLGKGKTFINSAIKVFSTFGNKAFMPDGISWIVEILKSNPKLCECLLTTYAERMIKRLFYDHISAIKSDKKLIESYLWILNKMVELGSSNAYFIRENVITYKKAC